MLLYSSLAAALSLGALAAAQTWPYNLIGTWTTKSNMTLTGPGFYDPLNDKLIEPARTGISYSFTGDGHYEEAYYRAIANPQNPACPSGIMQWQHGNWVLNADNTLSLTPIVDDGRQLLSTPCDYTNAIYTRYNQSEQFESYHQYTDPYHNIPRLDLLRANGIKIHPMYLVFSPPQMLPTTTLHPKSTASSGAAASSGKTKRDNTGAGLFRRGLAIEVPFNWKAKLDGSDGKLGVQHINADRLWWLGLAMTGVGGLLYMGPRRMGLHL